MGTSKKMEILGGKIKFQKRPYFMGRERGFQTLETWTRWGRRRSGENLGTAAFGIFVWGDYEHNYENI